MPPDSMYCIAATMSSISTSVDDRPDAERFDVPLSRSSISTIPRRFPAARRVFVKKRKCVEIPAAR